MTTGPTSAVPVKQRNGGRINWIVLLILGALTACLGIVLLVRPASVARFVTEVVGIYWLIAGLIEIIGLRSDRAAALRTLRIIGAIGAMLSGALVVLSMIIGRAVTPDFTRYVVAITALLMGLLNLVFGMDRAAPSRARQILGVVYILLGIVLVVNPAVVPSFIFPLVGLLLLAAGAYAIYLAVQGRHDGAVAMPGSPIPPEVQKQEMLDQARSDVARITQQAKDSDLGPKDEP